jgi:hypothetical protein
MVRGPLVMPDPGGYAIQQTPSVAPSAMAKHA